MGGWLLSIVGVAAIGVLLDILLPKSELNKYIKGIFAIVVVFVIVAPIPKLINSNFDISDIFKDSGITTDKSFSESVNKERNEKRQEDIKDMLIANSIPVKRVRIGMRDGVFDKVEYVKIYCDGSAIGDRKRLEEAQVKCRELIGRKLNVAAEEVRVYAE